MILNMYVYIYIYVYMYVLEEPFGRMCPCAWPIAAISRSTNFGHDTNFAEDVGPHVVSADSLKSTACGMKSLSCLLKFFGPLNTQA